MGKIQIPPALHITAISGDGTVEVQGMVNSQIVLHTIGLDRQDAKVYNRHYQPYRNYYFTYVGGTTWPLLCKAGYAESGEVFHHENRKDTTMYWLTRKGLDWLGAQLGIVIHDEWK